VDYGTLSVPPEINYLKLYNLFKKGIVQILLILILCLSFGRGVFATDGVSNSSNLDLYVKNFYNRYSKHFDIYGLGYSSPTYGVTKFKKPETAREWMALASYYKYRSRGEARAQDKLRRAIYSAFTEMAINKSYKGFAAAEANFLAIRMMEADEDLIDKGVKKDILVYVKNYLKEAISGSDTENRQIVAAAHWQYVNNYLYKEGITSDKEKDEIDGMLKLLVDKGINESIDKNYWYFENRFSSFTPHYHAVSAFMLMVYGDLTDQSYYLEAASKMYYNLKKISFRNGMVEAKLGHRPIGLGAQFYLAMALMGNYFGDDDYRVYLFYGSGTRFFSDEEHPYRLEFHSTIEKSRANFHDDYAFSDIAELGLIVSGLPNIDLTYKYYFDKSYIKSVDGTFNIENTGRAIRFNNVRNVLGTYGNWSHLYTYRR